MVIVVVVVMVKGWVCYLEGHFLELDGEVHPAHERKGREREEANDEPLGVKGERPRSHSVEKEESRRERERVLLAPHDADTRLGVVVDLFVAVLALGRVDFICVGLGRDHA
jgi:hypothetical protein